MPDLERALLAEARVYSFAFNRDYPADDDEREYIRLFREYRQTARSLGIAPLDSICAQAGVNVELPTEMVARFEEWRKRERPHYYTTRFCFTYILSEYCRPELQAAGMKEDLYDPIMKIFEKGSCFQGAEHGYFTFGRGWVTCMRGVDY